MSIPTTCTAHNKDVLFHVLYGSNRTLVKNLIEECATNIVKENDCEGVKDAIEEMRAGSRDSINMLRVKFFLLLNQDECMRRCLCQNFKNYAYMTPLCTNKARGLYDELHDEAIPHFLQDESVSLDEFVNLLRIVYLNN